MWWRFIAYAIPFLLLLGCATEQDRLRSAARYNELEKHLESQINNSGRSNTDVLFKLCETYGKTKKYSKLFTCLDKLDENIKNGDTYVYDGPYKSNISAMPALLRAEAFLELGNLDKAIEYAKTVNVPHPEADAGWIYDEFYIRRRSLVVLALANAFLGNHNSTEEYRQQIEKLSIGGFIGAGHRIPLKKQALSQVYVALGEYGKALPFIEEAIEDNFTITLIDAVAALAGYDESVFPFWELPKRYIYNKCLLETGRIDDAKKGFEELLKIPQLKENGDIYWLTLFDRGRIAEKEGNLKGAIQYYHQAIDVIEQQRSTINTEVNKIGFVGDKQAVYQRLVTALLATRQYISAFEYVERSKSRALVDMLAAKQDFAVTSGDPAKVRSLLAMAGNAEAEAMLQVAATEKIHTRSLVVSARQQLNNESPELASLVNVSSLAASEIQALIPQDETLVEYYYNAPDLIAFVLTSKGLSATRLDSSGLLDNVRQYRKLLESPGSADYQSLSRQLYNQLIRPVADQINVKKLIIVAHGPLHYMPFNALHDGQSYLIDRYSLRMLPSASVLKYLRSQPVAKQGNILAFGNPDLGNPKFDLVYAQDEAIAVTKKRPQSKVLLRKDANEAAFRQYGGEFRYLHFATHGEFNADAPLKSALLLARDEQNDGRLTVDKLYSLKLDADLVTLSACETGLGKIANGDDVVGLTRGFLYAGTSTIVASLWQVDDQATSYLMTMFYENLQQADKREALRQAQLDTRKKYAHPYYWAAFQITGSAQ